MYHESRFNALTLQPSIIPFLPAAAPLPLSTIYPPDAAPDTPAPGSRPASLPPAARADRLALPAGRSAVVANSPWLAPVETPRPGGFAPTRAATLHPTRRPPGRAILPTRTGRRYPRWEEVRA